MERTNPRLWETIKNKVTREGKGGLPGQWSARKAQLAVRLYKEKGGRYKGHKTRKNALHQWTIQNWKTKSGLPSLVTGERYLPEKAIDDLTPQEYYRTSAKKRSGTSQFVKQPRSIARKTRKYRKF